jgi:choline dehydrogenase
LGAVYDYVIVGGGSGGCVLARRLSEDPDVEVLLVEAGPPDDDPGIHTPSGYLELPSAEFDWEYLSAPEPECDERRLALPRGKVLGGCSSTNAMIHIRGNAVDYDDWGVAGWSWEDLLPYFIASEDNERGATAWLGTGGPLAVSEPRSVNALSHAFIDAGVQAGLARNEDFNGSRQDGVGLFQLTQRDGRRASAAVCYLRPAMSRPNLTVMTHTLVERVLFEGTRAVGVRVNRRGERIDLRAEREVLLCGGSYNSPQLLMLSGVGPAEHLLGYGLDVLVDQPSVGENLSDHAATEVLWMARRPSDKLAGRRWRSTRLLLATQQGPFASGLAEAGGFARLAPDAPAPDVQLHFVPVRYVDGMHGDDGEAHGVWLSPCLLTPRSRGSVRLSGADPAAKPVVSNGFYRSDEDLARMIDALRLVLEICSRPALRAHCAEPFTTPAGETRDALRAHLARTTFAFYHPVGTCRMGLDAAAVVDDQLRVNGIQSLRVVDASVMPAVPRGNTNAPTIALAERAADLIRHGRALRAEASPPHRGKGCND